MIQVLSALTASTYKHALKPLLFRLHPDTAHQHVLRMSRVRQKLRFSDPLVRKAWAHQDKAVLGQTIDGVFFPNPVGLSAGFDKNIELAPTMKTIGFGFMTGGSVTLHACAGNPKPWYYRLPQRKALVVHAGLANEGVERICARIRSYKDKTFTQFPLVVSAAKTNNARNCDDTEAIADYVGSLDLLKDMPQVRVLELNISCPNTYGGEPFTDPKRLDKLLSAIDARNITKPIWVKMPINHSWKAFDALLAVIVKHKVRGVTIGNLNKDRSGISTKELPPDVKGNLSGLPTQQLSDNLIAKTYKAYGNRLTIIGVGGIFTAEDAYRKIQLGASLVELVSGMIFEGPQVIGQINRDLVRRAQKDGYTNISEAVGASHTRRSRTKPPKEKAA
ncbi:dihydroorotate dehydrogenase (quinone) [Candidatus Saccharibacteria bacterium]|nr:MAG: dihydroorotate dehydrogenase (quinone) [Candidatus Saccharibacteria bacterium]